MATLNQIYTERWFRQRDKLNWRVEPFCKAVWETFGGFKSIVDVGCAIGEFIAHFTKEYRCFAIGFDGSENCLTHMAPGATIYIHDLRQTLDWGRPMFDLCMCLEVAEHLEPEYADTLVKTLVDFSTTILFTAAHPGQEGTAHYNLQPPEYWIEKFAAHGYEYRPDMVKVFRQKLEAVRDNKGAIYHKKGIRAYYENAMVFKWTSP